MSNKQKQYKMKTFENERKTVACVAEFAKYRTRINGEYGRATWCDLEQLAELAEQTQAQAKQLADACGSPICWAVDKFGGKRGDVYLWDCVLAGTEQPK